MAQTYSIEFKEEACKRVQSGVPAAQVARELLGQCPNGEFLGQVEAGMAEWAAFPNQRRSKISRI